jgi:hypothetical protein
VAATRIQAVQRGRATRARLLQGCIAAIRRCAAARCIQHCYFASMARRDARDGQQHAQGSGFEFEQPTATKMPTEQPTKPEMPTEQPTKPERPTEQLVGTCTERARN